MLYGLTEFPKLSDRDICKTMKMNPSTFSTTKKKLLFEGFYHTSYDPILQHLGYNIQCRDILLSYEYCGGRYYRTDEPNKTFIALKLPFLMINQRNLESFLNE